MISEQGQTNQAHEVIKLKEQVRTVKAETETLHEK